MSVICSANQKNCSFEFSNTMSFTTTETEVEYWLNNLLIDGRQHNAIAPTVNINNNQITRTSKINLKAIEDKDLYQIERKETRKYDIETDNVIYYRAVKITNNITLAIEHPASFTVDLKKCGTIKDFELRRNTALFKEYTYNGIIYPQQGYIILFKKENHEKCN